MLRLIQSIQAKVEKESFGFSCWRLSLQVITISPRRNWRSLGLTRIKMRSHYAFLILVCVDVIHYVLEMTKDGKSAAKASNVGFED
jgi:hypothetical protein